MRCVECQTDPLTPGHYCECCGRKLSQQERKAVGTPGAEVAPIKASPSAALVSSSPSSDVPRLASSAEAALPPLVVPEMAPASNGKSETLKVETAKATATSVVAARMAAAKSEQVHTAKVSKPEVMGKRPIVSVPSRRRTRSTVLAAAVIVIVAAIGVPQSVRWLGIQRAPQPAREGPPDQPTPVAETVTVADRLAPQPDVHSAAETATKGRESIPAPTQAVASARPKPATTSARPLVRTQVEALRQPNPSTRQVAPVLAPNLATEALALVAAPAPPAPVAAEPPLSIAPAAPIGRFFEPTDVDESPQVATRVEPQLPTDLPVRPLHDIVVVRVLVSQTGHPFHIRLLRGSKLGRSLDDAVVAAVSRWTFSPARKRGEAVNCWYNIGVPLGRAN